MTSPPPNLGSPAPRIISLDIETYGKVQHNALGTPLPLQRYFHPIKCRVHDGVPFRDLVVSAAITVPTVDPPRPLTREALAGMRPGPTITFRWDLPDHRATLRRWLLYADTIMGMNLPFDIGMLRHDPLLRQCLPPFRHTLIDLSCINFLNSDVRPERSLKTIGRAIGTHDYDDALVAERFTSPHHPGLHSYNAQDTHNTLIDVVELCATMAANTDKASEFSLTFYSDALWSSILMSEAGIPMSVPSLYRLYLKCCRIMDRCKSRASTFNLTLEGEGSTKSKTTFLNELVTHLNDTGVPINWRLVAFTEKTKMLSVNEENRQYFASLLPRDHPIHPAMRAWATFNFCQKLVSTYIYPLLWHRRNKESDKSSRLIPIGDTPWWPSPLSPSSTDSPTTLPTSSASPSSSASTPTTSPPNSSPSSSTNSSTASRSSSPPPTPPPSSAPSSPTPPEGSQTPVTSSASETSPTSTRSLASPIPGLSPCPAPPAAPAPTELVALAYPSWYVVPTFIKDTGGPSGGTQQGRITCKGPSGQTFPPHIKMCEVSRFPGGVILSADLSQIELRVAALLSGDESLVTEYQKPKPDLHTGRAIQVFGPDVTQRPGFGSGDSNVDPRQWAKQLNFADLFLATALRMQKTILELCGVLMPLGFYEGIERSRSLIRPGLTAWQYRLLCEAETTGRITLPFTGQSRSFLGVRVDHAAYQNERRLQLVRSSRSSDGDEAESQLNEIVNMPVQTTAGNTLLRMQAHIAKHFLSRINAREPRVHIFLNVYDALYFDVHPSAIDDTKAAIAAACAYVATQDYWAMLQAYYGRTIPLTYGTTVH